MRIEKPLEPPKNGLLLPELVPVAYEVLDNWKVLIRGLSQLDRKSVVRERVFAVV